MIENWGYKLVDEITWVKKTVNGKIAKGHGFYLQHAKESCLIGVKVRYYRVSLTNNFIKCMHRVMLTMAGLREI
jgi:N6-adenosine-specific RNA methylase IME4